MICPYCCRETDPPKKNVSTEVSWNYCGKTDEYEILIGDAPVHRTRSEFERDLFIAKLLLK